jgi:hypothetical protein
MSTFLTRVDLHGILCSVFGVGAIIVLLGSTIRGTPPYIFADNLTMFEIHIIPGLYMKPLTMFSFMFFLSYGFGLNSTVTRKRILRLPKEVTAIIYVVAWLFAMGSGFEVIYHVVLWSAALSVQGLQNPDTIINPWPSNPYPINVVLSSKLVFLIFALSCFTIDYLRRIQRDGVGTGGEPYQSPAS